MREQLPLDTMHRNSQRMWLIGCGWDVQRMHQMRDSRMRLFYTEHVPEPFIDENTLLQVRWQQCWQSPMLSGDLS